MKHLFRYWDRLRRTLGPANSAIWFFDFDGTLAPIVRHPQRAQLPRSTRRLLKELSRRHPRRVGILSGRPLGQIKTKVGIQGLIYAGTHGYEIAGPGIAWRYKLSSPRQKRMRTLAEWIRNRQTDIPGFWMEDKCWTICVHYRQVKPKDMSRAKEFLHRLRDQANGFRFVTQRGLKTLEIFSDPRWDKGKALQWIERRTGARGVFYMGDDSTDETVFRAGGRHRVMVRVGQSDRSRASYYVTRQEESRKLLERILSQ